MYILIVELEKIMLFDDFLAILSFFTVQQTCHSAPEIQYSHFLLQFVQTN